MTFWLLLPLLLAVILVRCRWIVWHLDTYTAAALYWAWRTKQSQQTLNEMSQLWPTNQIVWSLWTWDFRHFVVHQDLYDTAMEFVVKESLRQDLGWDSFEPDPKELDSKPKPEDDTTHGPN